MYNDSLLELIETFTPNEKNNFKRYINFTGGGRVLKYEELYNIYNKYLIQGYDKTTFDKKVKTVLNKKPKLNKDLNNVRKRLKDKLLESLSIQSSSNSRNVQITKGINEVRILIERKLYQAANQKIKQLKDKASTYNLNKYIVELIEIEISIITKNSNKGGEAELRKFIDDQEKYLHLYTLELKLKNILSSMVILVSKDLKLNKKKNRNKLHKLYNKLNPISIEAYIKTKQVYIVLWYYRIESLYNRLIGDIDLAYELSKKLIIFFETDEVIFKNFQKEYVKAICSFSRICFHLNKDTELNHLLSSVQSIYQNKKNYNALEATCEMGVLHYVNTYQYEKANDIASLMDENWQYFQRKTMDGKLLWYTHTNSILYWILDDGQNLELWANRGLSIKRPYKGKVYLFGIRMLMLTHDYDADELLHFNEKVQALQKTMSNNDDLKLFEKTVMKYLKKLVVNKNSTQRKKEKAITKQILFNEFKTALLDLKKTKSKFIEPINYEEILLWCESHLQNKSIREVFETQSISTS